MAGTLVKRVLVQVTADDMDAEEKLEAIALKADELRDKHPELKIRIDTAEAQAKMAVLRGELKDLSLKADEEAAKGGILSRFLGGSGLGNLLSKIPGVDLGGGAGGAAGDASAAGGDNPSLMGVLIGGAIATAPAWLSELDALVSGFAAAGAGAGAFYLLAHPAISNLTSDVSSLSTANQALGIAQQKYLIDPTKANATALKNAQDTYQATYKQMGQDAGGAAAGVVKLHNEYTKLSTAFQPEAFKVMNGVLQVANELLPHVTPFATTFADAFSGLLAKAGQFAGSKGFTDWLAQFQKLEGPSITAIGVGVGHLATSFGKLLTNMSAKDVVNGINIAFSVLDGTILAVSWVIKATMDVWDIATGQWDVGVGQILRGSHVVASSFDAVRHAAADMGHGMAIWFDTERHDVASLAAAIGHDLGDVVSFFRRLPGEIGAALSALPGELFSAGEHAASMFVNGLRSIPVIGTVVGWAQDIADHLPHSPAKKGPLSGAGSPDVAGRRIGLMLASGMAESTAAVAAANARMARAAGVGGTAAGGTAAGGSHITIQITGDAALRQWLKKSIRVTGGNVQVVGA